MLKLTTRNFGAIEFPEENIITFEEGIVGFKNLRRFLFIDNPDTEVPFHWIQSVDDSDIAFVVVDPMIVRYDYEFEVPKEYEELLEIAEDNQLAVLSIVVIPERFDDMTCNLIAPIIINASNRKAAQIVLVDDRYNARHHVMSEMDRSIELRGQIEDAREMAEHKDVDEDVAETEE